MKVALYARVSSEKQDVDLSISAQIKALRAYAAAKGLDLAGEYVDEAESGKSAMRPVFQEMMAAARRKPRPFDGILVWKLSRFARNREDSIIYKSMLKKHGVQVISINEPIENSPTGKMVEGMIEVLDEFYVQQMAQDIVRGMREAVSRGFWVGSRVPYGYRRLKVPDGKQLRSKLEPDAATAPTVRGIFDSAAAGAGAKDIASKLNIDGVPAPASRFWTRGRVRHILNNPVYMGRLVWGVSGQYHHDYAMKPVEVADACPAIVDEDTFKSVQALLAQRSQKLLPPRRASSPYLLSGVLRCSLCRKVMVGVPAKGHEYRYYTCSTSFRSGRSACAGKSIRQDVIERLALQKLQEMVLQPDHIRELVRLANEEARGSAAETAAQVQTIDARIRAAQERLSHLYDALETGKLALDDLAPRIKGLRADLQALTTDRERAGAADDNGGQPLMDEDEALGYLADMEGLLNEGTVSERRVILKSFVKEILKGDAEATVFYTLPMPAERVSVASASAITLGSFGGAEGTRTPYLFNAIEALSQLSYSPIVQRHPLAQPVAAVRQMKS